MSTTSSRNFTTLYSGAGSVVPQGAYGNANVVSLLSVGTDGANTVGNISATGAINTTGTISATGNIVTAGYFIGSFEGNITGNISVTGANTQVLYNNQGNVGTATGFTFNNSANVFSVPGTITAVGNVTAPYFIGNGSQLTGLPATYSNANVATYLASGTNSANIITSANISGSYILGNGSQLTGLPATYGNANVSNFLANGFGSNTITTTGNTTSGYFIGNGSLLTNINAANVIGSYGNSNVVSLLGAFGSNAISTTGNVTASYFIGNGSLLTNINAGNITGLYGDSNVVSLMAAFGSNTISTTGNITAGNIDTTGNIGSTQQTIIGTANATAFATGNVVVSGKNIATDVVFVPDASTTTTPTGGRVLVGTGIAGNTSIAAWDPSNILRGPRVAIMDSYTKNNASVVSGALATYAAVSLDGNITAAGSRVHGITSFVNVSGGAAGNTYLTTGAGAINNGLNAISGVLNLGGTNANLVTQIGANITTRYATTTSGLLQFYGNGTVVGNGYGHIASMFNQATGNISIANVAFYGASAVDAVATTANVGNTIGYLFPDTLTGQFGLGSIGSSFQRGNLYAFMNAGNLAQVRLGSTIEQHYYAYPIPTTTGNVTINAVNGQVQTVTPTGAMAITDVTNLVNGAFNLGTSATIPQSQSVTVQIRQGATGYAVTLPTTLSGGPVYYADGFNTVSTTAYSTTFVTFYQVPSGVSGGGPFYAEVKSSDAGGGAAGSDGLIQFNLGGVANTGGRLGSAGNLFWTDATQTLQTQNCNVVSNLNALGNINGGTLSTGGTISATGNITGGNLRTGGSVSATGNVIAGNITTTGISNLGSLKTYNEEQYTLSDSGTVNINKNNGQVQYLSPIGNVTIGSLQNFVSYQGTIWQADTVTLIVKQQATPYTVTMPTGNAAIKYAGNLSTVGTTANSVTMVAMTSANLSGVQTYMITVSPEFV